MGAVYEAIDTRLQNTVAVKQTTVLNPIGERAFEREAKTLAGLRHPALPVVSDYFTDAGGQFLVMQFIDGDDLSRLLRRQNGPCASRDVLAWALTLLDALDYLHSHQPPIVHRDIKPANLRRTSRGEIVLLDFGLAKTRAADETRLASDRSVYGYTPHYAPPEQIEGRDTDARSDLYALGATLYHLTVGFAPGKAADRSAAVRQGLPDPLVAPHLVDARIGEPFGLAVVRALQLDPERRFVSAAEMRDALLAISGAQAERPSPPPEAGARRIDAAMPSVTEVGRQTDLIVQVRFAESPLLGIEDWPTRRRPDRIEQGSEPLRVSYPVNPYTGALMPARLLIKLVAPDFVVAGESEHLIDVPPDEYSKRLAFLLTARRPGLCRLNVEVFGADAVYLGIIPVEVEAQAGAAALAAPELRVANILLEVFARHLDERAAAESALIDTPAALPAARIAPTASRLGTPPPQPITRAAPRTRKAAKKLLLYAPLVAIALAGPLLFWQLARREFASVAPPVSRAEHQAVPPPSQQIPSAEVPVPLPKPDRPPSPMGSVPAASRLPTATTTASPAMTMPAATPVPPASAPGLLTFTVDPANATVVVLRKQQGQPGVATGSTRSPMTVDAGDYVIRASADGYYPKDVNVSVLGKNHAPVHIVLDKLATATWSRALPTVDGWQRNGPALSLFGEQNAAGTYTFIVKRYRGSFITQYFGNWIVAYRDPGDYVEVRVHEDGRVLRRAAGRGEWTVIGRVLTATMDAATTADSLYVRVIVEGGMVRHEIGASETAMTSIGAPINVGPGRFGLAADAQIRGFSASGGR
jgi:hypothetical protein